MGWSYKSSTGQPYNGKDQYNWWRIGGRGDENDEYHRYLRAPAGVFMSEPRGMMSGRRIGTLPGFDDPSVRGYFCVSRMGDFRCALAPASVFTTLNQMLDEGEVEQEKGAARD